MRIAAIYMAAGQSRRMGVPKLSLELAPGNRMGSIALKEMMANDGIHSVFAVVRPCDARQWASISEYGEEGRESKLRLVACEDAARGMSHSLRAGLQAALATRPDA